MSHCEVKAMQLSKRGKRRVLIPQGSCVDLPKDQTCDIRARSSPSAGFHPFERSCEVRKRVRLARA
jgi:hypothetical protein